MIVSLMLVGDERSWLEAQIRACVRERIVWRVLEAGLGALPVEGLLAIGADSARDPRLKKLLTAAVERLGEERCALLLWTDGRNPDLRGLRACTPQTVIYLPREVERVLAWVEGARGLRRSAGLSAALRSDLPGILAVALRHLMEAGDDPSGSPPPSTVAELARATRVDRAHLHRQARLWDVDFARLISHTRARWVLSRYQRRDDLPEIVRALGHRDERPLRRLLRATVDRPLAKAWAVDPDATTGAILLALGRAAKLDETG